MSLSTPNSLGRISVQPCRIPTPRRKSVSVRAQLVGHLTQNNEAKFLPLVASYGFIDANMRKVY